MTQPLVSILIPFFNEEAFIKNAIQSCLNQTYKNIEIILVDDFSTDRSVEIIQSFHSNKIKLAKGNEKGVGFARNKALELMTGHYCAFLDADDQLAPEFVEVCLQKLIEFNCDIAVFGTKVFNTEGEEITKKKNESTQIISGPEALLTMYSYEIIPSVWGKLFSVNLLSNQKFSVGFVFEDKPFMVELFLKTKQVFVGSSNLYLHYANPNSITRSTLTAKRISDSTTSFFKELETLVSSNQDRETLRLSFVYQLNIMVDIFLMIWMDRKVIPKRDILSIFHRDLAKINREASKHSVAFSVKRDLLLKILTGSKIIGARIPFLVLKNYYRTQYNFIKNIKK